MTQSGQSVVRIGAIVAGIGLVAGGVWLGAGIMVGKRTAQALNDFAAADRQLRVYNLQHQTGLLVSTGQADICAKEACDSKAGRVHVTYVVDHLPLPSSLLRFSIKAQVQDENGQPSHDIFTGDDHLSGIGRLSLGGSTVTADLSVAAIKAATTYSSYPITVQPSQIHLVSSLEGMKWTARWQAPEMTTAFLGTEIKRSGVTLDADYDSKPSGDMTCSVVLSEKTQTFAYGSLNSMTTSLMVARQGERGRMTLQQKVADGLIANNKLKDLGISLTVDDILITPWVPLAENQGGSDKEKLDLARKALVSSLDGGLSIGIPQLTLTMTGPDGKANSANGSFSLKVSPRPAASDPNTVPLVSLVSSKGMMALTGEAAQAQLAPFVMKSGMVRKTADGLASDFEFANNHLTINGKPTDAAMIVAGLTEFDKKLRSPDSSASDHEPDEEDMNQSPEEE